MIHHRPRPIRPASRIDFAFPRAVFRWLQWVVVIAGVGACLASTVSGLVGVGVHEASRFYTSVASFLWTAAATIIAWASVAGILALFQIADDIRDQLELDLQLAGRGEIDD